MSSDICLGQLLQAVAITQSTGLSDSVLAQKVRQISNDSRQIEPAGLFVAIRGYSSDGHCYCAEATRRGALALIVEELQADITIPQIQVEDTRLAQAQLACAFYANPSASLKLLAVTGSNGKTTTSLMIKSILERVTPAVGVLGTVAYQTGKRVKEAQLTTPDSLELQRYLAEMKDADINYAVMELSSIGQVLQRTSGTHFTSLCFLNLGREHLDFHGSMANYFAAKSKAFFELGSDSGAVLNADDAWAISLKSQLRARILTFGHREQADVVAQDLDLSTGFAKFTLRLTHELTTLEGQLPAGCYPIRLTIPGYTAVLDALAAITSCLMVGVSPEDCIQGIEAYQGVERRFQAVYNYEYLILDDHFANAANISMSLETLTQMAYKNLVLVYAIRGNRGVIVNQENVRELLKYLPKLRLKELIVTLARDCTTAKDEVQPAEEQVFKSAAAEAKLEYRQFDCLDAAIERSLAVVAEGDVILLAGCQGMDAGARLALQKLAAIQSSRAEDILRPLKDRVCGW